MATRTAVADANPGLIERMVILSAVLTWRISSPRGSESLHEVTASSIKPNSDGSYEVTFFN